MSSFKSSTKESVKNFKLLFECGLYFSYLVVLSFSTSSCFDCLFLVFVSFQTIEEKVEEVSKAISSAPL